ncbi:MAG TPA: GntR family transcriptional regulator [Candidatus Limnocylindria bacterium]|jgi:GntR family transcriptional regulator|nr:GntR family transcriptional regulator [Candidatus Limnocylindria bacterium]
MVIVKVSGSIAFHLDPRSGIPTYLQLVQQTKHAVRYGMLRPGDQLPTAREVVEELAINPNTVLKAYRELERDGFVRSRPGAGTFVADGAPLPLDRSVHAPLRRSLDRWLAQAHAVGLDRESVIALFTLALQDAYGSEDIAHARGT